MTTISPQMVKDLRTKTGAGMMDCKKALEANNGDIEKSIDWLRAKGISKAAKRGDNEANQGAIGSYIHDGRIGVMVELNCETDFVAKTDEFRKLLNDLCLHICANDTQFLRSEDIPAEARDREKSVAMAQLEASGKPAHIAEKAVGGRMEKWQKEICLMTQPFIHDENQTVEQVLTGLSAKIGEKIAVRRFSKFIRGA